MRGSLSSNRNNNPQVSLLPTTKPIVFKWVAQWAKTKPSYSYFIPNNRKKLTIQQRCTQFSCEHLHLLLPNPASLVQDQSFCKRLHLLQANPTPTETRQDTKSFLSQFQNQQFWLCNRIATKSRRQWDMYIYLKYELILTELNRVLLPYLMILRYIWKVNRKTRVSRLQTKRWKINLEELAFLNFAEIIGFILYVSLQFSQSRRWTHSSSPSSSSSTPVVYCKTLTDPPNAVL